MSEIHKGIKWAQVWRRAKVWIVLVIAVFAFAILGVFQTDGGLSSGGPAAIVNGEPISLADFNRAVQQAEANMRIDLSQFPEQQRNYFANIIRQQALSGLIGRKLLAKAANESSLYVDDTEVADFIFSIPGFQSNGVFSRGNYEAYLTNMRLTASAFENELRAGLLGEKVQMLFARGTAVSNAEVELKNLAASTQVEIEYIGFDEASVGVDLKESDIEKFAADHSAEISKYYEDNKAVKFTQSESVKASHILVKFSGSDASSKEKAKEKILKAQKQLETDDFSVVAKKVSEDIGSASKGGDLGYFGRKAMVPAFEKAAFGAKVGEVVGPIESTYGYHLIKVFDKKESSTRPLAEVQKEIVTELAQKSAAKEQIEVLSNLVKEGDVQKAEQILKARGLKWETTGEFELTATRVPKLGPDSRFLSAAMSVPVGQIVSKLLLVEGRYYLLKPKSVKTNKSSGPEVDSMAGRQRADQIMGEWIESVKKNSEVEINPTVSMAQ